MSRQQTPDIMGNVLAARVAPATTMLPLNAIVNDGGTQMRAGMDAETVTEYESVLAESTAWPFPPAIVYHDGDKFWLADGFHRLNAAHRSGKFVEIPADIRAGTRRDAVLHAAGANASHGLRRTNADKRRAVETLLRDDEWRQWSDREIAKRCLVSHNLVSELRRALTPPLSSDDSQRRRIGGDGRTINTANIGTNRPAAPSPASRADLPGWLVDQNNGWAFYHPDRMLATTRYNTQREAIAAVQAGEVTGSNYHALFPSKAHAPERRPEMFEIEQAVRQVAAAQRVAASDLRLIAKQRIGRVWQDVLRGLPANTPYRDIAQACNNVAEQMTQRQAAPAPDTHRADTAPTTPLTVHGDQPLPPWAEEPAPATEAQAVATVATEAHGDAPAQPQADPARPWADDRTWELRRLENTLQNLLRTVSDNERRYGELTGRHSDVLNVRHGLETMIRTCRVNQGLSD